MTPRAAGFFGSRCLKYVCWGDRDKNGREQWAGNVGRVQAEAPPDLPLSPFHDRQAHSCALCTPGCSFGTSDISGINSKEGPRVQIERQHEYVPDGQEPEGPIIPVECAGTQQPSSTAAKCVISSCAPLLQTQQFISSCTSKHAIAGRCNKWHLTPQDIITLTASTQGCSFFFNTKQKHLKPWCAAMRKVNWVPSTSDSSPLLHTLLIHARWCYVTILPLVGDYLLARELTQPPHWCPVRSWLFLLPRRQIPLSQPHCT